MAMTMKLMIASDIHGSALYCQKLLTALEKEQADRLLLLGDILYHGPRNDLPEGYVPKEVIALLNAKKEQIFSVRGNCDCAVDQTVLEFPILSDCCLIYAQDRLVFATHGHLSDFTASPALREGDILLHGHTHIPACRKTNSFWYLNPGSVSIPKENSPHSYMILEDGIFCWKDLLSGISYRTFSLIDETIG